MSTSNVIGLIAVCVAIAVLLVLNDFERLVQASQQTIKALTSEGTALRNEMAQLREILTVKPLTAK